MLFFALVWSYILQATQCYSIPRFIFDGSILSYSYDIFPSDRCQQMQLSSNYIGRLGSNNVVEVFNKANRTSVAKLINFTYSTAANGSLITANLIHSFSIDSKEANIAVSLHNGTKIYGFPSMLSKTSSAISQFYTLVFNNSLLSGINRSNSTSDTISVFSKISAITSSTIGTILTNYSLASVKNCKCSVSPDNKILAFWDQSSNVFLYFNPNNGSAPTFMGSIFTNSTVPNLTQAITFSPDSQQLIIEVDDYEPIKIVSLANSTFLQIRRYMFNGTISKALFTKSTTNNFIVIFDDQSANFLDSDQLLLVYTQNISNISSILEVDIVLNELIICQDSGLAFYKFQFQSVNCSYFCKVCQQQFVCLLCEIGYTIIQGLCQQIITGINNNQTSISNSTSSFPSSSIPIAQNSQSILSPTNNQNTTINLNNSSLNTSSTPSSNSSTLNNNSTITPSSNQSTPLPVIIPTNSTSSNSFNNSLPGINQNRSSNLNGSSNSPTSNSSSSLITNLTQSSDTFMIIVMADGSFMFIDLTAFEEEIINKTAEAIKYSNLILEKCMTFLNSTPYIYFCLSFLQFFTISSLYAFLNVSIPEDIYTALKSTFNSLNSNLFTITNTNLPIPEMGVDRALGNTRAQQFGISTLFIDSNYQFLILSQLILILLAIFHFATLCLHQRSVIIKAFTQTRDAIISGIIISGMTSFLLPTLFVFSNPFSTSYSDKINQNIQFTVIGMVLVFPGLFISSSVLNKIQLKKIKKIDESSSSSTKQKANQTQKKQKITDVLFKSEETNIYLCLVNLFFPLLVFIQNPNIFLGINEIVLVLGLIKSYNSTRFRINKIILSIYPIIFHNCFFIFSLSSSPSLLIITSITCLMTYFIGSIHQILTLVIESIHFLIRFIRKIINRRQKIVPRQDGYVRSESITIEKINKIIANKMKEEQQPDARFSNQIDSRFISFQQTRQKITYTLRKPKIVKKRNQEVNQNSIFKKEKIDKSKTFLFIKDRNFQISIQREQN